MDVPPCLTTGEPLNACARRLYAREVQSHFDLSGPWSGWRVRGKDLISPDGDRVCSSRLRGLLFVAGLRGRLVSRGNIRPDAVTPLPIVTEAPPEPANGVTRSALP